MKKILYAFLIASGVSTFVGCSSDDSAENLQNDERFVEKMTVKLFSGQPTAQLVGTFDFNYSGKDVTSIMKVVTSGTGDILESQNYTYQYDGNKIVSYQIANFTPSTVTYNGDKIKNLGFGSDLEYTSSGLLHKDSYGTEYVYLSDNPIGTSVNPYLYTYDDKKNPFAWHNMNFRLIFEEQFELYQSTDFFRSSNNLLSEADGSETIQRTIEYNSENLPTKITTRYAGSNQILEEITYEYSLP
ncbi:hypothetical protein [Flavobacterium sp.]|uniref:hypothetical protein n=1 Tax=Flavobacterium sp. TaxID=239 RepID=UPI0012142008|nr:hypothetical protein [Flavobacterium sp.]RZJ73866.1 MAG: hypothetical protein EOO49_00485 [Flavobacterium sp.]